MPSDAFQSFMGLGAAGQSTIPGCRLMPVQPAWSRCSCARDVMACCLRRRNGDEAEDQAGLVVPCEGEKVISYEGGLRLSP